MIKKSILFLVYLGLILRALVAPAILASEPRSAIDWLAEKINDAPDFFTLKNEQRFDSQEKDKNIRINQLPGVSKNSLGFFGGKRVGLPIDVWSNESEILMANKIENISESNLFHLNRFLKRILLVEVDPPVTDQSSSYAGRAFLRARISKLINMGALDDAEALIESADPFSDTSLLDLWTEISFLTRRLDNLCKMILESHINTTHASHRVICLARSGDWNAAALALATYSSIGDINDDLEALLINYLDHEAELDILNRDICLEKSPVMIYLCGFSGIKISDSELPIKFLYANLGRSKSLRTRIASSEDFVRSGSLDPSVLFSNYRIKQPSASGGIWARAEIIQKLDQNLNDSEINNSILLENLSMVTSEFTKQNLLAQFAEIYGSKLNKITPKQDSPELNEIILALVLLSGDELGAWKWETANSSTINIALHLATRNIGWKKQSASEYAAFFSNFHSKDENELTLLERVVLRSSFGIIPSQRVANDGTSRALVDERDGVVLLEALAAVSSGLGDSDLLLLQTGLAFLVRLGLVDDFRLIATEILITDYFRNSLDYF